MKLIIEDDEGHRTAVPLACDEVTIGRQDGNTIRLTERNVSRRHARLRRDGDGFVLEDLGSYTGVRVNGDRIQDARRIQDGDLIEIGNYDLGVQTRAEPGPADAAQLPAAPAPEARSAETLELPKAERPRLVGLTGGFRGRELSLVRSGVSLGRTGDNDLVVDHPSVSRQHCRFVRADHGWEVQDCTSVNGVRVDGAESAASRLRPGSVVELGHVQFRFCAPGEVFVPGRESSAAGPRSRWRLRAAVLAGVVAAAGLVAWVAAGLWRGASAPSDEPGGAAAARQGDAAFASHDYLRALELYARSGSPSANRARAAAEARGQTLWNELEASLAAQDADRARTALDRCTGEVSYWCGRAQEKAAAVRALFSRVHLERAAAARAARDPGRCVVEAEKVLAGDPADLQAAALAASCRPPAAAPVVPPAVSATKAEAEPAEREKRSRRLADEASEKLRVRDFAGAVAKASEALALEPSSRATRCAAARALGYAQANQGDSTAARRWLREYLPCAEADRAQVEAFLAQPLDAE